MRGWRAVASLARLALGRQPTDDPRAVSPEAVQWAYRLFLDRHAENMTEVLGKAARLPTSQALRQEFMTSEEFKLNNPAALYLSLSGHEPPMPIEMTDNLAPLFAHIQRVWERLGATEPYWSVATVEQFRQAHIAQSWEEFYTSGRDNVKTLMDTLDRNRIDRRGLQTCLEYGCGLGRVTRWLAAHFATVHGVDISRSHLALAERNLAELGVGNVVFHHLTQPGDLAALPKADVVYSVIVLQHNPPPIMHYTIGAFLRALNPGGVAFFQLPTYLHGYRFQVAEYLAAMQGGEGDLEMHVLPQSAVFDIVAEAGARVVEVLEDNWVGLRYGARSNTFVVRK